MKREKKEIKKVREERERETETARTKRERKRKGKMKERQEEKLLFFKCQVVKLHLKLKWKNNL